MDKSLDRTYIYEAGQLLNSLEKIYDGITSSGLLTKERIEEAYLLFILLRRASNGIVADSLTEITYRLQLRLEQRLKGRILNSDEIREFLDIGYLFISYYRICLKAIAEGEALPEVYSELLLDSVLNGPNKNLSERKGQLLKCEPDDISEYYIINIYFRDCEMMSMRAYVAVKSVQNLCEQNYSNPSDLVDERTSEVIKRNGLIFGFIPKQGICHEEITNRISQQAFFDFWELIRMPNN